MKLQFWKPLSLESPLQPGRPKFITAASGLIEVGGTFYCVADDEEMLMQFSSSQDDQHVNTFPLGLKELPLEHKERKKAKSDFESLVWLDYENAVLVVPSGSKPQRKKGYLIEFEKSNLGSIANDGKRGPIFPARKVDFSLFYNSLLIPDLNIEGAVQIGSKLAFLQRGNSVGSFNAVITVDVDKLVDFLKTKNMAKDFNFKIEKVDLGELNGHPLSFTDACPYKDGLFYFLAAAEGTDNTYDDGEFLGAVVGTMDLSGRVVQQHKLEIAEKPEGICYLENSLWLVTDADNAAKPSKLYKLDID